MSLSLHRAILYAFIIQTVEVKHTLGFSLEQAAEFAFFLVCHSFVYTLQSSHGEYISTNNFAPAKGVRFSLLLHFTSHDHQQTSAAEEVEMDVYRVWWSKLLNPQLFHQFVKAIA